MGELVVPEFIDPQLAWVLVPTAILVFLFFTLSLCDGWPDAIMEPVDDEMRPLYLTRHRGSFEDFIAGPVKERKVVRSDESLGADLVMSVKSFQEGFEANRSGLYSQLLRTAVSKIWKGAVLSGTFSLGVAWCIVNGVYYDKVELSSIFRSMEASVALMEVLLPVTSCFLAFYVNLRLNRFSNVVAKVTEVSGALEEIAIIVGSNIRSRANEKAVVQVLWTLNRYLNLVHILIYLRVSRRFEHHTLNDLLAQGFITTSEELMSLKDSADAPGLATLWVSHVLMELHNQEVFEVPDLTVNLIGAVCKLRSSTSALVQEVTREAPLSCVQLIQLAVDAICLLTTPVLIHNFLVGRSYPEDYVFQGRTNTMTSTSTTTSTTSTTMPGVAAMAMLFTHTRMSIYAMPFLGSLVVFVLWQGSLQVVKEVEDPFGPGMDRLNPDIVLDMTTKKILVHLRKGPQADTRLRFKDLRTFTEAPAQPQRGGAVSDVGNWFMPGAKPDDYSDSDDGRESVASLEPQAKAIKEGRPSLPTAVVFSEVTMEKLTKGAHEDARDLQHSVKQNLQKLEYEFLDKLEEDDPYLLAVRDLIPKLQQNSIGNAELREQVVSAVAGMKSKEDDVLKNPTALRKARNTVTRLLAPSEVPEIK